MCLWAGLVGLAVCHAGGLAVAVSALRAGDGVAARCRQGAAHRPSAGSAHARRVRGVPRSGPAGLGRQRGSPGDWQVGRVRHRLQAVDRPSTKAPTGWPGTTTTRWTAPWRRSAGKPRRSAAYSAPPPPRCCAFTAPTSKAAAWTPMAWQSYPPAGSARHSATTRCCRTATSSCWLPQPRFGCGRPPDLAARSGWRLNYGQIAKWLYAAKRGERPRSLAVWGVCHVTPQCSSSRGWWLSCPRPGLPLLSRSREGRFSKITMRVRRSHRRSA
jgi:hypothetical protein